MFCVASKIFFTKKIIFHHKDRIEEHLPERRRKIPLSGQKRETEKEIRQVSFRIKGRMTSNRKTAKKEKEKKTKIKTKHTIFVLSCREKKYPKV